MRNVTAGSLEFRLRGPVVGVSLEQSLRTNHSEIFVILLFLSLFYQLIVKYWVVKAVSMRPKTKQAKQQNKDLTRDESAALGLNEPSQSSTKETSAEPSSNISGTDKTATITQDSPSKPSSTAVTKKSSTKKRRRTQRNRHCHHQKKAKMTRKLLLRKRQRTQKSRPCHHQKKTKMTIMTPILPYQRNLKNKIKGKKFNVRHCRLHQLLRI